MKFRNRYKQHGSKANIAHGIKAHCVDIKNQGPKSQYVNAMYQGTMKIAYQNQAWIVQEEDLGIKPPKEKQIVFFYYQNFYFSSFAQ